MMAIALKLLRHKATWGVGIVLGFAVAIAWHGHTRYSEGKRDGIAQEHAAWQSEAALARASALSAQVAADAAMSALRDSLREATLKLAVLSEARALAEGKYAQALRFYRQERLLAVDSTPPSAVSTACDELANACEVAMQSAAVERMALHDKLRLAELQSATQDSVIRSEPARTQVVVREALAVQRAAQPKAHRVVTAIGGALAGSLLTLLVH